MISKTIKTCLVAVSLCGSLLHTSAPLSPAHLAQLKAEMHLDKALALFKK